MGKKKQRAKQTSKGERRAQDPKWGKAQRRDYVGTFAQAINQREAWSHGKRVMLTIPNPNSSETNKPFIRVLASEVWGDWRGRKVRT